MDHVLLVEVMPRFPYEYVIFANQGAQAIELRGWAISDGEGTWTFDIDLALEPGGEAFVCSNLTFARALRPKAQSIDPSSDLERKGRLALADEGDEVILLDPCGRNIDVLAWGKSAYPDEGWSGARCAPPAEGKALRRLASSDTDSSADWGEVSPGRTGLASIEAEAVVEPFLCPDQMRERIIREIAFAQHSLEAAVYELTDRDVASWLAEAAQRGVRVRLLVEGQPVGGMQQSEAGLLQALQRAGCEVRAISSWHGFKRYDFLHCKYLVSDSHRVLLGSENWASTSLDGNRGWGAIVQSKELARAFMELFEFDFRADLIDVQAFDAGQLPTDAVLGSPGPLVQVGDVLGLWATIRTAVSPDHGLAEVIELMDGAQDRVLMELFYASVEWPGGRGPIQAAVDAARRGVSVRLLLDPSWYNNQGGGGNQALAARLNALAEEEGLDLRAKLLSAQHGYTALHNKGMVADDAVLISSINWVPSAFMENREAAIIVLAEQAADFFAGSFFEDWTDDSSPPLISVQGSWTFIEGEGAVLVANITDEGGVASVTWDVGPDGSIEGEGDFLAVRLPVGRHLIELTARDNFNNSCSTVIEVLVVPSTASRPELAPIAAATLAGGALLFAIRKRVKKR
ncbi:MAG: phospholipase D-like domain-containing protein [Methanomassiliicoccales archaeon]|nr:phospholipase D-like domain-containing protein [Methanomassiliicoccales archaeon]